MAAQDLLDACRNCKGRVFVPQFDVCVGDTLNIGGCGDFLLCHPTREADFSEPIPHLCASFLFPLGTRL